MTARNTSRTSYVDLLKSGNDTTQVEQILAVLKSEPKIKDLTLKEISRMTGLEINAVSGRVNQMKKQGLVKEQCKRPCRISGRTVTPIGRN
tara:strand:+ start:168 stop:440 length:273 start_codon:yes stop_codon:yes gene_type:complete